MEPDSRYLGLLTSYAAGKRAEAIAALGEWTEDELEVQFALLHSLARTAQRCRTPILVPSTAALVEACAAQAHIEQLPLRAAVMLHADREGFEQARTTSCPGATWQCGDLFHGRMAEHLTELVLLQPNGPEFARRFYVGMALQAHSRGCFLDAQRWSLGGLQRFPKDGVLNLALGTATDSVAFLTPPPPSFRAVPTTAEVRQAAAVAYQRRHLWEEARRALERAVAAEPQLDEASLRLGRVLLRLEKNEAAREALEAALARSEDPQLRYLAHLFLGRIHEQAGRAQEAAADYRAALGIQPASQVATVALAHLRETQGETAEARNILERGLEQTREHFADPYWEYYAAIRSLRAETLFEALRREALQ